MFLNLEPAHYGSHYEPWRVTTFSWTLGQVTAKYLAPRVIPWWRSPRVVAQKLNVSWCFQQWDVQCLSMVPCWCVDIYELCFCWGLVKHMVFCDSCGQQSLIILDGFRCPNVPELYMRVSLLLRTNQASHVVPPMPLAVPYSEKSVFASWCQESSLPQGFGKVAGWEWKASVVIFPFKIDASLHSVPSTLIMGHGVYLKIMSCPENMVPKLLPFPMGYIK